MKFSQILLEYDRTITIKNFTNSLLTRAKSDTAFMDSMTGESNQTLINKLMTELENMDPTPNKQWVIWIIRQYIKNSFRIEDSIRIFEILSEFKMLKSSIKKAGFSVDLNQYNWRTLNVLLNEMNKDVSNSKEISTNFQYINDMDILSKNAYGILVVPKTKEASIELGKGTRWCTSAINNNMFDYYNADGPLYIWIDKSGDKYQFHFESNQYMDSSDISLPDYYPDKFLFFVTSHPVLSKLFNEKISDTRNTDNYRLIQLLIGYNVPIPMIEPHILEYGDNFISEYAWKNLNKRWPEGEARLFANINKSIDDYKNINSLKQYYTDVYMRFTKNKEWPEYEKAIMPSTNTLMGYIILNKENLLVLSRLLISVIDEEYTTIAIRILEYMSTLSKITRIPDLEKLLEKHADHSQMLEYMRIISKNDSSLNDGWDKFETSILKSSDKNIVNTIIHYVMTYRKNRWPEGEKIILEKGSPHNIFKYSFEVIKHRWPEGEEVILNYVKKYNNRVSSWGLTKDSQGYIYEYIKYLIKGRWKDIEPYLVVAFHDDIVIRYATDIANGRVEGIETSLLSKKDTNYDLAVRYTKDVINQKKAKKADLIRWKELEDLMIKNSAFNSLMIYFMKIINFGYTQGNFKRWKELENLIVNQNSNNTIINQYKSLYSDWIGDANDK